MQGLDELVQVNPPGDEVAVYPVIALPPLDPGAVQLIAEEAFPVVPDTLVGDPGGAAAVTLLEAVESTEFPAAFVARTLYVYAVPFVNPVTVQEVVVLVQVNDPGVEVAVYPVIALPPLDAGAVQLTRDEALATVPETLVGAPGTVRGVTDAEAVEALEVPLAFVAVTVNV